MLKYPMSKITFPYNHQAEQSVLGCLMLDYLVCGDGLEKLAVEDFYDPKHKFVFQAMQNILEHKDRIIDLVTVVESLRVMEKFDQIGGISYLNSMIDIVPSVANFRHYFDIVKSHSTLRKLYDQAEIIQRECKTSEDEQATLSRAEKAIFDISRADENKELTKISQELPTVVDRVMTIKNDPTAIYGIKTGFYGIDNMTNGLHGGELVIIAARPGVGKTSLGLNMILNAAISSGKKCAVFSLEMSKSQLAQRALCSLAMVSSYKAGRGELDDAELQRIMQATEVLDSAKIYIDDNSDITATEIMRKCMRLKREQGLDFVMVDYLGLMQGSGRKQDNRQVEVAANSRAMKILAKELDIPVLLLSQLNRNVETRNAKGGDAKPALHDLRESGAVEQDADLVAFIHMNKPEGEDEGGEKKVATEAEIIIAKHRNGPCGTVKLAWQNEYTTFQNLPAARAAQDAMNKAAKSKRS